MMERWLKTHLTVVYLSAAFEVISLLMLPVGPELQELVLIAPRERGEWLRGNRLYVKGDYSNLNTKYWQLLFVRDCNKFFLFIILHELFQVDLLWDLQGNNSKKHHQIISRVYFQGFKRIQRLYSSYGQKIQCSC